MPADSRWNHKRSSPLSACASRQDKHIATTPIECVIPSFCIIYVDRLVAVVYQGAYQQRWVLKLYITQNYEKMFLQWHETILSTWFG